MKRTVLTLLVIAAGAAFLSACAADAAYAKDRKTVIMDEKGPREAFLGVFMSKVTADLMKETGYSREKGVLISEVIDESPADDADIEEGDIIVSIDGEDIEGPEQLAEKVSERKPGDRIEVELFRDGKMWKIEVELGEKEDAEWVMRLDRDDLDRYYLKMSGMGKHLGRSIGHMFQSYRWKLSGLEVVELNEGLAEYFDVDKGEGVLVTGVAEDSIAEEIGFESGDVIVEVDGEEIESVDNLNEAVEESEDQYKIVVVRKGDKKEFMVDPEDFESDYQFYGYPKHKEFKIRVPRLEHVDLERMKLGKEFEMELQEELEQLKEKLKELKDRLEKIEKDSD